MTVRVLYVDDETEDFYEDVVSIEWIKSKEAYMIIMETEKKTEKRLFDVSWVRKIIVEE